MALGDSFRNAQVRVGDPLGMTSKLAYLTADNTNIDCTGIQYLEITSNNTTAANRTFTLTSSSLKGHQLFIVFTSGSSNKAELLDSGTCRLAESTMTFTQYKSIMLVSDGTYWYEQVRGANTTLTNQQTVALTADNQAVDPTGYSSTLLTSDSTQTARTFTVTAGAAAGTTHRFVFTSATNRAELAIAATMKINDPWFPAQYDAINLISDGTRWIELSRSYGNSAGGVASVALSADNQSVVTEGLKMIILTSDDATAANRTFVPVASSRVGHELTLLWNSANEGQLADTATVVLVAAWEPTNLYQSIRLISDGTRWIEVCRADPT